MISFSMLHASVITAAEEIWRMWCVRKEVGRVRLYLVPSRPRFLHPGSCAAGGKLERAHRARADPAEGLDDDGDDHVVLLLSAA